MMTIPQTIGEAGSWALLFLVMLASIVLALARYPALALGGLWERQREREGTTSEAPVNSQQQQQQQQQQLQQPHSAPAEERAQDITPQRHQARADPSPASPSPTPTEHVSTTDMLADLLQQFFDSSDNTAQWVAKGGLATLRTICQSICSRPLVDPEHQKQAHQISWLLLQVAHGPHAARAQLQDHIPMHLLAKFMACVLASPTLPRKMQAAIQRNCCWALSSLCDVPSILRSSKQVPTAAAEAGAEAEAAGADAAAGAEVAAVEGPAPLPPADGPPPSSSAVDPGSALVVRHEQEDAAAALGLSFSQSLLDSGVLRLLASLLREDLGLDASSFAATLLASLAVLEDVDPALAAAAQQALLEPGASLLLCTLLSSQRHGAAVPTLHQYLRHMLARHEAALTWQLLYDRAVQDLLQAVPGQLGLLIAYQLLSPPGQETMVAFEAQFCVDVALALAHLITSDQANKLVRVPVPEGEDDEPASRTYSLRAMASRMMLGGERLEELITACFDDLAEAQAASPGGSPQRSALGQPPAAAVCGQPWITDTVCAATQLLAHLESLNMQLSHYRALNGMGVEDLSSIASSMERVSMRFEARASGGGPSSRLLSAAALQRLGADGAASERSLGGARLAASPLDTVSERSLVARLAAACAVTSPLDTVSERGPGPRLPSMQSSPLDKVSEHVVEQATRQTEEPVAAAAAPAATPACPAPPTDIPSSGDGVDGSSHGGGGHGSEDEWDNWEDDKVGEDLAQQRSQTVTIQNSSLTASTASIICVSKAQEQWGKVLGRAGEEFRPRGGEAEAEAEADDAGKRMAQDAWRLLQPDDGTSVCTTAVLRAGEHSAAAAAAAALALVAAGAGGGSLAVQKSVSSRTLNVEEHKAAFHHRSASARTDALAPACPEATHESQAPAPDTAASGQHLNLLDSGRPLEGPQPGAAATVAAGDPGQPLLLSYGRHSVTMSMAQYRAVRRLSGLLHAWLSRCALTQLHTVLQVPGFSDQENCVVVRALVAVGSQQGEAAEGGGSSARVSPEAVDASQAVLVWQAADYYQVDYLKDHCEDLLMKAISRSLEPEATAKARPQAEAPVAATAAAADGGQDGRRPHDALYELLAMEPSAPLPTVALPAVPLRPPHRDDVVVQVVQECGRGGSALELGGGGMLKQGPDGPGSAAPVLPTNTASLSKGLADILDLMTRYHHSSGRLQHLLAVLLMRHMHRLVADRGLAELLARHKEELMPGLVSLMRDRLVSIVMLSDGLDEET